MTFNKLIQIAIFIVLIFYNFTIADTQMVAVKSNMASPEDVLIKRQLIEDLSSAATKSNFYLLPVKQVINSQWEGEVFVNDIKGFSIIERERGGRFSEIKMFSPSGKLFTIINDKMTCPETLCSSENTDVRVESHADQSRPSVRMISFNGYVDIKGRWLIQLSQLQEDVSDKDFIIAHEGGSLLAIYDHDQTSLSNKDNKFILELRKQLNTELTPQNSTVLFQKIESSNIKTITAKVSLLSRGLEPNSLPVVISDDYKIDISPEGEISTTIPSLPAGNYSLEIDLHSEMDSGDVIQRTGFFSFPVLKPSAKITGTSNSKILDSNRLGVELEVNGINDQRTLLFYAEVWGDDQLISSINTMTYAKQGEGVANISIAIDTRWFALAGTQTHKSFELRNIKLLDPDTFLLLDQRASLLVAVEQFPEGAFLDSSEVSIDDNMLYGLDDIFIPVNLPNDRHLPEISEANGIFLVHGWCDNTSAWNSTDFDDRGPVHEFVGSNPSLSRNQFALEIMAEADNIFRDWFSIVAHSQGGQAAAHLNAYYFSKLDSSPAPRPIQTVGTPFRGSILMDIYISSPELAFILPHFYCTQQFTLTNFSSVPWSDFLPNQGEVFYHRTTHNTINNDWRFWLWTCHIGSALIPFEDDGTVGILEGILPFGNNMGVTLGQCHNEWRYPDQRRDLARNDIMDQMGRAASWTSWLNRDTPGQTGDWELRSLHDFVCTNPIAFQARRVGTNTPANQTGEVFSTFSASGGLVCRNSDQPDNQCFNYEVRFFCP